VTHRHFNAACEHFLWVTEENHDISEVTTAGRTEYQPLHCNTDFGANGILSPPPPQFFVLLRLIAKFGSKIERLKAV
jgi:hypothetical protein